MTFSKIAFVVAAVGADSVSGQKPGVACKFDAKTNPCTDASHPTGMSCKIDKFDKKGIPESGTCVCSEGQVWDGKKMMCSSKAEQKINKCITNPKCMWNGDDKTGKCVLQKANALDCNKDFKPDGDDVPTWVHCRNNGQADAKCVADYWPEGKKKDLTCSRTHPADDPCEAINSTQESSESSIVMV